MAESRSPLAGLAMLPDVLEEHLDEISFLYERWRALRDDASAQARDRSANLERLQSHVDGLRLGADQAWELCLARLEDARPGDLFAAALVALDGPKTRMDAVEATAGARPALHGEIDEALALRG